VLGPLRDRPAQPGGSLLVCRARRRSCRPCVALPPCSSRIHSSCPPFRGRADGARPLIVAPLDPSLRAAAPAVNRQGRLPVRERLSLRRVWLEEGGSRSFFLRRARRRVLGVGVTLRR